MLTACDTQPLPQTLNPTVDSAGAGAHHQCDRAALQGGWAAVGAASAQRRDRGPRPLPHLAQGGHLAMSFLQNQPPSSWSLTLGPSRENWGPQLSCQVLQCAHDNMKVAQHSWRPVSGGILPCQIRCDCNHIDLFTGATGHGRGPDEGGRSAGGRLCERVPRGDVLPLGLAGAAGTQPQPHTSDCTLHNQSAQSDHRGAPVCGQNAAATSAPCNGAQKCGNCMSRTLGMRRGHDSHQHLGAHLVFFRQCLQPRALDLVPCKRTSCTADRLITCTRPGVDCWKCLSS
jgi:hypothetical protein